MENYITLLIIFVKMCKKRRNPIYYQWTSAAPDG